MPFVLVFTSCAVLKRVRWVYIHPHRRCVLLPYADREIIVRVRNRLWILARLAHGNEIIWDSLPRHGAILVLLLIEKSESLCALHCCNRVFPNRDFAVIDESCLLKSVDKLTAKVFN